MDKLTLGQLYYLARKSAKWRYEAILELDRRLQFIETQQ